MKRRLDEPDPAAAVDDGGQQVGDVGRGGNRHGGHPAARPRWRRVPENRHQRVDQRGHLAFITPDPPQWLASRLQELDAGDIEAVIAATAPTPSKAPGRNPASASSSSHPPLPIATPGGGGMHQP
jgi:hypothetical protein